MGRRDILRDDRRGRRSPCASPRSRGSTARASAPAGTILNRKADAEVVSSSDRRGAIGPGPRSGRFDSHSSATAGRRTRGGRTAVAGSDDADFDCARFGNAARFSVAHCGRTDFDASTHGGPNVAGFRGTDLGDPGSDVAGSDDAADPDSTAGSDDATGPDNTACSDPAACSETRQVAQVEPVQVSTATDESNEPAADSAPPQERPESPLLTSPSLPLESVIEPENSRSCRRVPGPPVTRLGHSSPAT